MSASCRPACCHAYYECSPPSSPRSSPTADLSGVTLSPQQRHQWELQELHRRQMISAGGTPAAPPPPQSTPMSRSEADPFSSSGSSASAEVVKRLHARLRANMSAAGSPLHAAGAAGSHPTPSVPGSAAAAAAAVAAAASPATASPAPSGSFVGERTAATPGPAPATPAPVGSQQQALLQQRQGALQQEADELARVRAAAGAPVCPCVFLSVRGACSCGRSCSAGAGATRARQAATLRGAWRSWGGEWRRRASGWRRRPRCVPACPCRTALSAHPRA